MRYALRAVVAATLVISSTEVLPASSPRFWQVATQAGFLKGEVEGLSIDSNGRLIIGPVVRPIYDATVPFIWTLAVGPDEAIYSGSGNQGQVLRTDRKGATTVFVDTPELEVHALAFATDGQLYVGTSPDGKIYRVNKAGSSSMFFDPEDKYIWALTVDAQGRVFAATGEKGLIYRISPDGKGEVFYKSKSTHVTSLAIDSNGRLLAGTESPGRVIRLDADGKGFVLLDSPYREIHALRIGSAGAIYAAAVNGKPGSEPGMPSMPVGEPSRPPSIPSVSTEITSITVMEAPVAPGAESRSARRDDRTTPKGAVYRINADGSWDVIWDSRDDIPYDVIPDGPGAVMIGTGNGGKVYRVSGTPARAMLLLRAGGQQVTAFSTGAANERILATSNPAKLFLLPGERSAQGTYTSEVRDAGTFASWGTISWRSSQDAASRVQIFTRSGNTETPDDGWSSWAGPYQRADGDAVQSPRARYFQWKAVLVRADAGPALTSVMVGYLQRNQRPKVSSVTVNPPGVVFQRPYSSGELEIAGFDAVGDAKLPAFSMPLSSTPSSASTVPTGRRIYQKGLQSFVWRAEDDNDDKLSYDVYYRREGETGWRTLRRKAMDTILVWDTTSVPDGTYVLRVVASDLPSNPPGEALEGDAESVSFEIDNTPPSITITAFARVGTQSRVQCEVRDGHSPIDRVEYPLDGGPWLPLYPLDGVGDARIERYEVAVDGDATGRLVIKAVDALDNAASLTAAPVSQK